MQVGLGEKNLTPCAPSPLTERGKEKTHPRHCVSFPPPACSGIKGLIREGPHKVSREGLGFNRITKLIVTLRRSSGRRKFVPHPYPSVDGFSPLSRERIGGMADYS